MEGKDIETLSGMVPVGWGEFLGPTENDVEGVWARELAVEGVVG